MEKEKTEERRQRGETCCLRVRESAIVQCVLAVTPLRRVTADSSQRQPQESLSALVDTRFKMETLNGQHIKATQQELL